MRRQTWITRDDLRANRDLIYVFGDNVERAGRRGLAREMRGEPNAHGYQHLAKNRQHEHHRTDAQKHKEGWNKNFWRNARQLGQGGVHVATRPTREGRASVPNSSNDRTGFVIPLVDRSVLRKRLRLTDVMIAGK